jgi:hypothetical protein
VLPSDDAPACRSLAAVGGLEENDYGELLLDGNCSVLYASSNRQYPLGLGESMRRVVLVIGAMTLALLEAE